MGVPRNVASTGTVIDTADNIATYIIYPYPRARIWDVSLSVAIPIGAEVISIQAPPELIFGQNEQEPTLYVPSVTWFAAPW